MSSPSKAVVDHHVDRPGVEVARAMQLTGTNSLIGLIALIYQYSQDGADAPPNMKHEIPSYALPATNTACLSLRAFATICKMQIARASTLLRRPGGSSEEPQPDPIPNSAVKLLSANGTMSQDLGE